MVLMLVGGKRDRTAAGARVQFRMRSMTFISTKRHLSAFAFFALGASIGTSQASAGDRLAAAEAAEMDGSAPQIAQRRNRGPGPVRSGTSKTRLTLYGQLDRALLYANDGNNSGTFFVDNDNSSSRLGLKAEGSASRNLAIGGVIEFEILSDSSRSVSLPSNGSLGGASFNDRRIEIYGRNAKYGSVWLGQGHTASDGVAEVDLTRTEVIAHSDVSRFSGGMRFNGSGPRIRDVFSNMDGLGRDDRIRYDAPLWKSLRGSFSYLGGGDYDLAVRFKGRFDSRTTLAAAAGYSNEASTRSDGREQYVASVSARRRGGWSGALAVGVQSLNSARDPVFAYAKLAYERPGFFGIGRTAIAVDITSASDIAANNDDFISYGAYVVQIINSVGADVYAGVRNHQLSRPGTTYSSVMAFMAGARLKF